MHEAPGDSAQTLLVGVGNPLRGDDGVGIHVVRRLRERGLPDGCVAEELHGGWLSLLDRLHLYRRLVVVDAVDAGLAPGTIVEVELPGGGGALAAAPATGHALGLVEVLQIAREVKPGSTVEVTAFGIQVADASGFSESCSAPVAAALEAACDSIRAVLEGGAGSIGPARRS